MNLLQIWSLLIGVVSVIADLCGLAGVLHTGRPDASVHLIAGMLFLAELYTKKGLTLGS